MLVIMYGIHERYLLNVTGWRRDRSLETSINYLLIFHKFGKLVGGTAFEIKRRHTNQPVRRENETGLSQLTRVAGLHKGIRRFTGISSLYEQVPYRTVKPIK